MVKNTLQYRTIEKSKNIKKFAKRKKMQKLILFLLFLTLSFKANAYIGPGMGGGLIAAFIGIIVAIITLIFGIICLIIIMN